MNADRTIVTPSPPGTSRRSRQSLEFERFWRSLPKTDLLPHRRDFRPAGAASLLRYVMLLDAHGEPGPAALIRLVGSAIEERIQRDIKGRDYFEFLDPDRHADARASLKLMLDHPCGVWQIVPFHYERGTAQNVEATVFPMLGDAAPFMLALVIPREEFLRPQPAGSRVVLAGGATEYEFLDIGAGVPAWPPG